MSVGSRDGEESRMVEEARKFDLPPISNHAHGLVHVFTVHNQQSARHFCYFFPNSSLLSLLYDHRVGLVDPTQ